MPNTLSLYKGIDKVNMCDIEVEQLQAQILLIEKRKNEYLKLVASNPNHKHCMLCGGEAPLGLKLKFYSSEDQSVWAQVKSNLHHQGYKGILHGGFLAALLDSAMCNAIFNQEIEAVTGDMTIRYLHEVPVNSDIVIKGILVSSYSILYKVEADLYIDGKLMVKAKARFMKKAQ